MKKMSFDVVIENGRVIDGTGNPWFRADIGIQDDKIAIKRSIYFSFWNVGETLKMPPIIDVALFSVIGIIDTSIANPEFTPCTSESAILFALAP